MNNLKSILFFCPFIPLLLLAPLRVSAQQDSVGFNFLNEAIKAERRSDTAGIVRNAQLAAAWFKAHPDTKGIGYAQSALTLGIVLTWQNQLDSAIGLFQHTLDHLGDRHDSLQAVAYDQMGFCFHNKGQFTVALRHYKKALSIALERHQNIETFRDVALYTGDVGSAYYYVGDVSRAATYLRRAIALLENLPRTEEGLLARTWINYGTVLLNYAPEKSYEAYEKALTLYTSLPVPNQPFFRNVIYHSLSLSQLQQFHIDEAVAYKNKSAELNQNGLYQFNWYINAAACDCAEGKRIADKKQQGLKWYGILENAVGGNLDAIGQVFYGRAFWCYMFHGDYQKAADMADQGLQKIGFKPGNFATPPIQPLMLTAMLSIKTGSLLEVYLQTKNLKALQTAYETACQADTLAFVTRRFGTLDASQANILALVREVIEQRIETAYQLRQEALSRGDQRAAERYLSAAFESVERSKQFELLEDIGRGDQTAIPEHLLLQREEILSQLNALRQKMASDTSTLTTTIDKKTFDLLFGMEKINQTIDSLRNTSGNTLSMSEDGHQSKRTFRQPMPRVSSVKEICQSLEVGQAFLNYFVGDSNTYVMVLHRGGPVAFLSLPHRYAAVKDWAAQLRRGILGMAPDSAAVNYFSRHQTYVKAARNLYEGLMRPVQAHLKPRLLISLDGPLASVPFESLLRKDPVQGSLYSDLDYVLTAHAVSQTFSGTLWQMMQRSNTRTNTGFAGFAPSYSATSGLSPLDNQTELNGIKQYFGQSSTIFSGKNASKNAFFEALEHVGTIHVAAHAIAYPSNGELSSIYFADSAGLSQSGRLTGYELQSKRARCQLVSLSACETAIGEFRAGEGLIGLHREFAAIGVGAVAATLWNVNANSTGQIYQDFYARLTNKKTPAPKDIALASAKRNYLASSVKNYQPELCHPYYWSGISLTGSLAPLR